MRNMQFPCDKEGLRQIIAQFPTPFYLYDESAIRNNARAVQHAFEWVGEAQFKNFFAVKALPNPAILKILREEGMGVDCSSYTELLLAQAIGFEGKEIFFTSNNTPHEEFRLAEQLKAYINLDDICHIEYLHTHVGMPHFISLRYNPGELGHYNDFIGNPKEAKYGFTRAQLFEGYARARQLGARRFGLHTMVASNELSESHFTEVAQLLYELAIELKEKIDIKIELVNLGGGIGIPYQPEEHPVDLAKLSHNIHMQYQKIIAPSSLHPLRTVMENGRAITGPYGWLISKVRHVKNTYKNFIGLDATMADLMRPGMYGTYHHVTVVGKEQEHAAETYDVVGSLCENNDKFAIDRRLPAVEVGDIVCIHDAGAHGRAMGFNYNGKLRCAELLRKDDGTVSLIRRAETAEDYFATLNGVNEYAFSDGYLSIKENIA